MKLRKDYLIGFISFLCVFLANVTKAEAITFAEYVYSNVKHGYVLSVREYMQKGYSINAVGTDGRTALCHAVDDNDFVTYKRLRQLGASDNVECMYDTEVGRKEAFAQRYEKTAKSEKAFFSDNKTLKYATAGLLTAGVVTGVALANGGGGSHHDDENTSCPVGQRYVNGVCQAIECPEGTVLEGNNCNPIVCAEGQHLEGNVCVDDITCPEGQHLENGVCVEDPVCPVGFRLVNGKCEPIICPENTHLVGNTCVANESIDIENNTDNDVYGVNSEKEDVYNLLSVPKHPDDEASISLRNNGQGNAYGIFGKGHVTNSYVVGLSNGVMNPTMPGIGNIYVENSGNGNVYGVFSRVNPKDYKEAVNAKAYDKGQAIGNIEINNTGIGDTFGIFGDARAYNAFAVTGGEATGTISIRGKGNIYGVGGYAAATNAVSPFYAHKVRGDINIFSEGNGNIYGLMVSKDDIPGAGAGDKNVQSWFAFNTYLSGGDEIIGNINIRNTGNGNVYGMYGGEQLYNNFIQYACPAGFVDRGGRCKPLKCKGNEYIDGNSCVGFEQGKCPAGSRLVGDTCKEIICPKFYGKENGVCVLKHCPSGESLDHGVCQFKVPPAGSAYGTINLVNYGNGDVYGMYSPEPYDGRPEEYRPIITNESAKGIGDTEVRGIINIVNTGTGVATGLRGAQGSIIINSGDININNLGDGTAVGIYGGAGSEITNSGKINIYRANYIDTEDGLEHKPSSSVGGTAYGIYAEHGAYVQNSGEIIVSGAGDGAGIYLEKDATFDNSGIVRFNGAENSIVTEGTEKNIYGVTNSSATLNTDKWGKGEVVLSQGGKFFAENMIGSMGVSEKVVMGSMKDKYVLNSALNAQNVENLNLYSKSIMFDATKEVKDDGVYNVVLKRNNLNEIISDKNLSHFFESNYTQSGNTKIYDYLKKASTSKDLDIQVADVSGTDVIPNFRQEDAIIYRNLNRQFNDNLFNSPNQNYIGGYKYIDISTDEDGSLSGSDGTANVAYGLLKDKTSNGLVYGLGASIIHLESDYDDNSSRKSDIFGLWAPLGYDFNNGLKWYSKAYLGYGEGSYKRNSGLGKYDSDFNEYQYGLSNEMRYNMNLGHGFTFEPSAELNLLGIYADKIDEGNTVGAISTKKENMVSLEGGVGAYLSKNVNFSDNSQLTVKIGGIYYVEFMDPDDGFDASVQGMKDRYKLKNNTDDSHGVLIGKMKYNYKDLSIYGNVEQETSGNKAFSIDAGVEYNF